MIHKMCGKRSFGAYKKKSLPVIIEWPQFIYYWIIKFYNDIEKHMIRKHIHKHTHTFILLNNSKFSSERVKFLVTGHHSIISKSMFRWKLRQPNSRQKWRSVSVFSLNTYGLARSSISYALNTPFFFIHMIAAESVQNCKKGP